VKYIAALLLALALLAVPGLAFVPVIPVSDLEKITTPMASDYGTYSYTRVAVDAGATNSEEYTPQHVYSGILFGADEKDTFVDASGILRDANTGGVVANDMKTAALIFDQNGDPVEGVATDTTRQYIQQAGKVWLTQNPVGSDNENGVPYSEMGFEKKQVAWMSSKMDIFEATPESQAAVGGNWLEFVPNELSPDCQNAWLIEREAMDYSTPIYVVALGDADLKEAFGGSMSTSSLKLYPASNSNTPAKALMSGYTERFAGYDDASIAANSPWTTDDLTDTYSDNEIIMDIGSASVENFWMTYEGVEFDAPTAADFPADLPGSLDYPSGWITWQDETPENEL